jgi:hypothetical protein
MPPNLYRHGRASNAMALAVIREAGRLVPPQTEPELTPEEKATLAAGANVFRNCRAVRSEPTP